MTAKEKALKHVAPAAKPVVSRYIDEHTRQACKQQRELCFKEIYNAKPDGNVHSVGNKLYYQSMTQMKFRDTILNAPEPELE